MPEKDNLSVQEVRMVGGFVVGNIFCLGLLKVALREIGKSMNDIDVDDLVLIISSGSSIAANHHHSIAGPDAFIASFAPRI